MDPIPLAVVGARGRLAVDEPLLSQHSEHRLRVRATKLLVLPEGQLERRALQVVEQDVEVVRIDETALGRRVEEEVRMTNDELIDRRAARDQDSR